MPGVGKRRLLSLSDGVSTSWQTRRTLFEGEQSSGEDSTHPLARAIRDLESTSDLGRHAGIS